MSVVGWDELLAQMEEHGADQGVRIATMVGREAHRGELVLIDLLEATIAGFGRKFGELEDRIAALQEQVSDLQAMREEAVT